MNEIEHGGMLMSRDLNNGDATLKAVYDAEWEWRNRQLGNQFVTSVTKVDDFLPDVGEEAQCARLRYWEAALERIESISIDDLSPEGRVNYAIFHAQITTFVVQQRNRMYERPANSDSAFWVPLVNRPIPGTSAVRAYSKFEDEDDARRYLEQLNQIPRFFAQNMANMRLGVARGFGPPQVTMEGREAFIRGIAQEVEPENLRFFVPFADLPGGISEGTRKEIREAARAILRDIVLPAYRELLEFFVHEYRPMLPKSIAAEDGPDGVDFYRSQLREFTTIDIEPEDLFRIGMDAVEAITAEMADMAIECGFGGDVPALFEFLRTDPKFYVSTPRQLLLEAAGHAKKFDGRVHRYFGHVPRMRFGIVEPPPGVGSYFTSGRGTLDRYIVNTHNLSARPLYSLPALTLHEAAPGHSFQTSIAFEKSQHPEFRRQAHFFAYAEGWALYCERLGVEMGMYETPFEMMGMLSFQMWRAARLVLDVGIHTLGWTREDAQRFLREHTAISEHEITTEVDRYISWPGQACAYYLGQVEILRLRRSAEVHLGNRFNLRNFHDAVLGEGSMPLSVLSKLIEEFIQTGGRELEKV